MQRKTRKRFNLRKQPSGRPADKVMMREEALVHDLGDPFAVFFEWSSEADEKAYVEFSAVPT